MLMAFIDFLICFFCTTIGAISGVGGGVMIKPIMDSTSGLPISEISFLSGCTVLAMTIVSLLFSRNGDAKVDFKRGTALSIGSVLGGLGGKAIFDMIKTSTGNDAFIGLCQNAIMVVLTLLVLIYVLNKKRIHTHNIDSILVCALIGLILGAMSSFLGIGGGPINLMVLYYFFSMDTKTAALNSIYIIFFSQTASFISSIVQHRVPSFSPATMTAMVIGGVIGGILGRMLAKKMSSSHMDKLFFILLIMIIGISCYNFQLFYGQVI